MEELKIGLDLAVLGASGCAALYCRTLAVRLRRLNGAGAATPKALAQMTKAVETMREEAKAVPEAARAAARELDEAVAELRARTRAAEDLSAVLDGQTAAAERRLTGARSAADEAIAVAAARARIELDALSRAIEIAARVKGVLPEDAPAELREVASRGPVRQRASDRPNPFLRAVG
jgi:hypothetical protein